MKTRIKAPIRDLNELKKIIKAGADQVYCGVMTNQWLESFSSIASINRVERIKGSLRTYEELKKIIEYAHTCNVKVFLTLNSLYSVKQYNLLKREVDEILATDVDGIIIADMGIFNLLKQMKTEKELHASTGFTVFNSESVRFLRDSGVSGVTLPRSMEKNEIKEILENVPEMKYEIFIMNARCVNIDGFCTFQHGINDLFSLKSSYFFINSKAGHIIQNTIQRLPRMIKNIIMRSIGAGVCSTACSISYNYKISGTEKLINTGKLMTLDYIDKIFGCGGCAVYNFVNMGVSAVKIVGRTFPLQRKIKDILYLKHLIKKAEDRNMEYVDFKKFSMNLYRDIYGMPCQKNCYYPD